MARPVGAMSPAGLPQHAIVRPGECAFLNGHVVEEVHDFDFDARIRKGGEPAAEERGAGRLSHTLERIARWKARRRNGATQWFARMTSSTAMTAQ
jgi:hypothetical protein